MAGTSSFASSASLLVGLQLGSRLLTFALNQALLRFVSSRAFGTASIQFELLSSTILFLSREGFRNALIRAWNDHQKQDRESSAAPLRITNLSLVPTLVGIPVAVVASALYRTACSHETKTQAYFDFAVLLYAIAACVELASEPMHIKTMGELRTGVRVRAEGLAIVAKTVTTFAVLLFGSHVWDGSEHLALPAFALGQLAYASVVLLSYLRTYGFAPLRFHRLPGRLSNSYDAAYLRLSVSMTTQSVFKHLLTEGDKFLVSRISPLEDQGAYALASNYGSLIARILFQPVEEMSRAFFSKTLPDRMASDSTDKQDLKAIAVSATERRTGLGQSAQALSSILAVQSAASILLTTFGPPFMPLLLTLALPRTYLDTSAPQLLLAWVWYIPVLAANGVLEAFVASASTPQDIHRQSRWMAIFSAVFVLSTGVFWKLGFQDVSLIYANMANLLSRILFAVDFITSYYKAQQARDLITWWDVLPSRAFVLGAITSGVIVRLYSTRYFISNILVAQGKRAVFNIAVLQHVALGGALAVSCAALWWMQTGRRLSLPSRKRL